MSAFGPKRTFRCREILFAILIRMFAVGVFVASIPITYFLQRLNYQMRWYIVTDRSLRIRSGARM